MKNLCLFLVFLLSSFSAFAVVSHHADKAGIASELEGMSPELLKLSIDDFLTITPKQYRKITGKRLGIKNSIKLKAAQKVFKKRMDGNANISRGLYVVMAIFGLGWLAMGLISDWDDDEWIINLLLTILCWLPGLIHALVKMDDYV